MDNPARAPLGADDGQVVDLLSRTDEPWWSEYWHQLACRGDHQPELAVAATRGFVLTAAELADVGITRARARTRLAHGSWTAAGHGYTAPLSAVSPRHRHALAAAAAARRRPADAISGRSAAVLRGLPLMGTPTTPRLAVREESLGRMRPAAAQCFTGWLGADEITGWYGVAVTTVARTLVDLARHDRFDGIMDADEALRLGLVRRAGIDAALLRARGWPGVRQARDLLALADPRAESPLESVTRLRLHDDGFPPPEPQFWIGRHRVDLCWPWLRLVLEVDGRSKYALSDDEDPLWAEKLREGALRRLGWQVERVTSRDVFAGWPQTSAYLRPLFQLPRRVG